MPSISAASATDSTNRSELSTGATSISENRSLQRLAAESGKRDAAELGSCASGFPVTFPVRFPKRLVGREISNRERNGSSRFGELRGPPFTGTLNANLNAGLNENLNAPLKSGSNPAFLPR